MRIGQQGTLTRIRAKPDCHPRAPRDQRYQWAYIFGAVCPDKGMTAALVMPHANAGVLSLHLAEISKQAADGAHVAVLVLDGAGYYIAQDLEVPTNITVLRLPPYSPELNPVKISGSICARTSSRSPYTTTTTIFSTQVAKHGTSSLKTRPLLLQSQNETGQRSMSRAVGSLQEAAASSILLPESGFG